jgi:hypothetical protein
MAAHAPTVVILAGPNGAGKTTSARTLLAETLQLMTFVNADVIAQGLSGFNPESMGIEAGRVMLQRLHALAIPRPLVTVAWESRIQDPSGILMAGECRSGRSQGSGTDAHGRTWHSRGHDPPALPEKRRQLLQNLSFAGEFLGSLQ